MRLFSHARRKPITATAIAVAATTLIAATGALTLVSTQAAAEVPGATVALVHEAVPMTGTEKSAILLEAGRIVGLEQFAQSKRTQAEQAVAVRTRIVSVAKAQIGDRYVAGAAGPNRFDCSGLTRYVFKAVTGKSLPHQSHAQYADVKKIKFKDAKPGDLVFFFRNGAHHVGIYIGGKKMVDAAGYGAGVRISPITGSWWSATYSGMGRILPA